MIKFFSSQQKYRRSNFFILHFFQTRKSRLVQFSLIIIIYTVSSSLSFLFHTSTLSKRRSVLNPDAHRSLATASLSFTIRWWPTVHTSTSQGDKCWRICGMYISLLELHLSHLLLCIKLLIHLIFSELSYLFKAFFIHVYCFRYKILL